MYHTKKRVKDGTNGKNLNPLGVKPRCSNALVKYSSVIFGGILERCKVALGG